MMLKHKSVNTNTHSHSYKFAHSFTNSPLNTEAHPYTSLHSHKNQLGLLEAAHVHECSHTHSHLNTKKYTLTLTNIITQEPSLAL